MRTATDHPATFTAHRHAAPMQQSLQVVFEFMRPYLGDPGEGLAVKLEQMDVEAYEALGRELAALHRTTTRTRGRIATCAHVFVLLQNAHARRSAGHRR